jgi:Ser/Thr protein kinase RdoA (MazF antagonist)
VLDEGALLSEVLGDYTIPKPESCRFLTRGDADIYRVKTIKGNFYLKIYRPPRSLEVTEGEALFVSALSNAGIPVVKSVARKDGRFAFQVAAPEGVRPMLLYEEAPSPLPVPPDDKMLSKIGAAIAALHNTADQFNSDFGIPVFDFTSVLKERAESTCQFLGEDDQEYLTRISERLGNVLQQIPQQVPDFGLCHGDLVISNLRLAEDGGIVFFDFGDALQTWRVFDLSVISWALEHRVEGFHEYFWPAFISGYQSNRSLPEDWSTQLKIMLVLRQILFLGGNCGTLPLRLGIELFETDFLVNGMERLRKFVEDSGILA